MDIKDLPFYYARQPLSAFVQKFLDKSGASSNRIAKWDADVRQRLSRSATSGKLLRGCLVCYSYALCSHDKNLPTRVLKTAAALELSHTALLIHDDIIDEAKTRRGQASLSEQYGRLTGAPASGPNLALCAGDISLLLAFELMSGLEKSPKLFELFSRELTAVCTGQMQDIYEGLRPMPPSKQTVYRLMHAKTAGYSIGLPLQLGAVLAGASSGVQNSLYKLGLIAGTIFQIRDDELGVISQQPPIGKPVGDDIRQAKKTLLYFYLDRYSTPADRQRWQTIFDNRHASPADIDYVQRRLRHYKVAAKVQRDIRQLQQQAYRLIKQPDINPTARNGLIKIVEFCSRRNY